MRSRGFRCRCQVAENPRFRLSFDDGVFLVDGASRIRNVYSTGFLDARILVNDLVTVLSE